MKILYNIAISIVACLTPILSLLGGKMGLWARAQRTAVRRAKELLGDNTSEVIWFHCASLGEFEQGRQLIEEARVKYPACKLLVTFFSPSGYEQRKNYAGVDYVLYLPIDTPFAARRFVRAVRPSVVIFIKYEFWYNMLKECKALGAKTYVVSAIFNKKQYFFKWYGSLGRATLRLFDHIFVQNSESRRLLTWLELFNTTEAGDTRFDRVYAMAHKAKTVSCMDIFTANRCEGVFVAGSTWQPDNELLIKFMATQPDMRFVIVPHEIHSSSIQALKESCVALGRRVALYSEGVTESANVLIIDTIGLLSSCYRYADIAYVGGGFGVGIHNTLEAATYGVPVAFGTNYKRFAEAIELIALGGACSVSSSEELSEWVEKLTRNKIYKKKCSDACRAYVEDKCGATALILSYLDNELAQ